MTLDDLEKLCADEYFSVNDGTGKGSMTELLPGKMLALIACARVLESLIETVKNWDYDCPVQLINDEISEGEKALAEVYADPKSPGAAT